MQHTSIYSLLSKFRRDLGFDFTEIEAIERIGEAMAAIGPVGVQEEAVAFVEVKQHKCLIPPGTTHIIQVARDYGFTPEDKLCPVDVVEEEEAEELEEFVVIDCNGQPVGDYELAYYRPYYSMKYNYDGWTQNSVYQQRFAPIRLADHTFFSSVVCDTRPYIPYESARDEYTINNGTLVFSFKEGLVAIAYRKQRLDENGYPLIPDVQPFKEAITAFMRYKHAVKKMDGTEGSLAYKRETEADWHWYCQQAKNFVRMPGSLDQWQNHHEQSNYLLPRRHHFYGFFGRMAEPEVRTWNEGRFTGYSGYPLTSISPVS